MLLDGKIWVGTSEDGEPAYLLPQMANRHGLIAGATGTGKTVTLKVIAEGFSAMGVPVFMGDIKGDLSGMVLPGQLNEKIQKRLDQAGAAAWQPDTYPTVFWDVYGEQGHPIRTTVNEMGPMLLSRMLGLNETQSGVLNILFRVANDEKMLLVDLQDIRAMLAYVGENASRYTLHYGNVSKASVGAIQRALALLEDQGGDRFFGEPALKIQDWMRTDDSGRGYLNILACDKLFLNPLMYSTFMLWMLNELYELLPERGDMEKPRMVFFFDEAHLLFDDCSKQLMDKIEQIVRLIRSKGVGVYFITQNPTDVPMTVLGQLGNRVQHALRAYTPLDQKAVKVAAQTFRANPAFDTEEAITLLKTGEALLSFLDANGAPGVVSRATILPPQSSMGAISPEMRRQVIQNSPFYGVYEKETPDDDPCGHPAETDSTAMIKEDSIPMTNANDSMNPAAPEQQAAQPVYVQQTAQPVQQPVYVQQTAQPTFMVFDPATGTYAPQQMATMPAPQQPVMVQQPVVMQQPVQPVVQQAAPQQAMPASQAIPAQQVAQQPQTIQQNVLVQDPATGMYVQKLMTLAYNPATGQYVPVQTEEELKAAAAAKAKAEKEAAAAAKAAEKAEKERQAEERRQRADELREERAERARVNDSVLGRIKNTAISSATRNVTTKVTNSLMNLLTGKGNKK